MTASHASARPTTRCFPLVRRLLVACAAALILRAPVERSTARAADARVITPIHRPANPHVHTKAPPTVTRSNGAASSPGPKHTTFRSRKAHSSGIRLVRPTQARATRGSILGAVRDADNSPVRGAFVRLAKPGGHRFRSAALRHGTYTRTDGTFTMRAVRPGRYRVAATRKGTGHGYAATRLAAGSTERVTIDLSPARHTRRRK